MNYSPRNLLPFCRLASGRPVRHFCQGYFVICSHRALHPGLKCSFENRLNQRFFALFEYSHGIMLPHISYKSRCMYRHSARLPILQALLAAFFFGAAAPLAKLLLGEIAAIPMAGLLYLGSGITALSLLGLSKLSRKGKNIESRLERHDLPWLAGATLAGGVIAPVILLLSLQHTPASTASMLLNFESVATTLIAILAFKEAVGQRVVRAIGLITLACIMLSWDAGGGWGLSLGALGILAACLLWGLDNNFTRHISGKNPLMIVVIKGLGAGTFSLLLSLVLDIPLPAMVTALMAMALGAISYGLSIHLFILAMRNLGSARTSAFFGTAPFVGTLLAILILNEVPDALFWLSAPVMSIGAWLMLSEHHAHFHDHLAFDHSHAHQHFDGHHAHSHPIEPPLVSGSHAHPHFHPAVAHSHPHTPDLHHRHAHDASLDVD